MSSSRRELSGVKELVTSRRVQKSRPSGVARSDGGCIGSVGLGSGSAGGNGVVAGVGGVVAGGLLGGCSGGNDALAELTIEELASIPAGNHTSANHTGHSSHHKVSELVNSKSIACYLSEWKKERETQCIFKNSIYSYFFLIQLSKSYPANHPYLFTTNINKQGILILYTDVLTQFEILLGTVFAICGYYTI